MIGVYCLVPVIIILKRFIGEKNFDKLVWVFLGFACISAWTSKHELNWDIGKSFYYVGYFMVGFIIRKSVRKINNIKGILLIAMSAIVLLFVAYLRYRQALLGISDNDLKYGLLSPYAPLILIASVLIFSGISVIHIKFDMRNYATLTFYIYLFHAGIWDVLCRIITKDMDNRVMIPVCTIIVFFCSLIAAKIYVRVWKYVDQRYCISDKLLGCLYCVGNKL